MPKAFDYVLKGRESDVNLKSGDWQKFEECWVEYAQKRKMSTTKTSIPEFPEKYDVEER